MLWGGPGLGLPAGGPIMAGSEKEMGWAGLSKETLNELNLVSQAGRFYQMGSDIYTLIYSFYTIRFVLTTSILPASVKRSKRNAYRRFDK